MQLIRFIFLFFMGLVLCLPVFSVTWTTSNYGYWNSASNWIGGVVPPYTNADTFLIKHPIVIDNTLILQAGSYFKIDSTGGICGHEKMIVQTNALAHVYGILELDTLAIPGGIVIGFPSGSIILSNFGIISTGGNLTVTGGMAVGPWFICHQPEYSFLTTINQVKNSVNFLVFPNPASNEFTIIADININYGVIRNTEGREITFLSSANTGKTVLTSGIPNGVYYLELYDEFHNSLGIKKIVLIH